MSGPCARSNGFRISAAANAAVSDKVAASEVVNFKQQVMIISAEGIVIQTPVREKDPRQGITVQGRSTQGVKLQELDAGDQVVAIACFEKDTK